ncbi:MAG: M48 family metallopeptidase [Betaproteobacteria bacterium]|nr:M48 family metallopeptidase [Betaproteobacteria bacterium]
MRTLALALCLAAGSALAQSGVEVSKSRLLLLPAATVERSAAQQYGAMMREAAQKGALNTDRQQVERLRNIARQLIPQSTRFNPNAEKWRWEVNLISSKSVNAFCMPGGKIAFFTGIIDQLQLTDAEVAAIMGHEIAHALLEHGRARMSQQLLKSAGVSIAAAVFNLGQLSAELLNQAAGLAISLPYARKQETDSDLVGMELAARAGYDPRAAADVWRKMTKLTQAAGKGQPPQFLSTHPGHESRIRDIEANLPKVLPLHDAVRRK